MPEIPQCGTIPPEYSKEIYDYLFSRFTNNGFIKQLKAVMLHTEQASQTDYMDEVRHAIDRGEVERVDAFIRSRSYMKQTVVFDFDGVIHSYTSGWQGAASIPDPPVDGIREAIGDVRDAGYEVVVVSTRCAGTEGMSAIEAWLDRWGITVDRICKEKPPAIVYIDDRAICFDGDSSALLAKVVNFKPWYQN